jgi:hypothetical protein
VQGRQSCEHAHRATARNFFAVTVAMRPAANQHLELLQLWQHEEEVEPVRRDVKLTHTIQRLEVDQVCHLGVSDAGRKVHRQEDMAQEAS